MKNNRNIQRFFYTYEDVRTFILDPIKYIGQRIKITKHDDTVYRCKIQSYSGRDANFQPALFVVDYADASHPIAHDTQPPSDGIGIYSENAFILNEIRSIELLDMHWNMNMQHRYVWTNLNYK